jgi:hypothetical protein
MLAPERSASAPQTVFESSDVVQVSTSGSYACALKTTGKLVCWGLYSDYNPPDRIYTAVSVGNGTCALTDGLLDCWRAGYDGRFNWPYHLIEHVSEGSWREGSQRFKQISLADHNGCGVLLDGHASCWGTNSRSFGDVVYSGELTPPAADLFTQVSTGFRSSCGVKTDGGIACWGGVTMVRGVVVDQLQTVTNAPTSGTFIKVTVGSGHACAIRTDGTAVCWGSILTAPQGTFTDISVSAGTSSNPYVCAITSSQAIVCWANQGFDNSSGILNPPAGSYTQVSAPCAVTTTGGVVCWGAPFLAAGTPGTPTDLAATRTFDDAIQVDWSDTPEETRFDLQRRAWYAGKQVWTGWTIKVFTANTIQYVDRTVSPGVTYQYRLSACNSSGCSAYTPETTVVAGDVPSSPVGLVAAVHSPLDIDLTWTDMSSDETAFMIERRVWESRAAVWTAWQRLDAAAANATQYRDESVTEGYAYEYRLSACNAAGCSSTIAANVPGAAIPAAPSGASATANTRYQVDVTWTDESTNETYFKVERRVFWDVTQTWTAWHLDALPAANTTTYGDHYVGAGYVYEYRVSACNNAGCSGPVAANSVTTPLSSNVAVQR